MLEIDSSVSKRYVDQLAYGVIGAAMHVHNELGPGLLESVYQKCLVYELEKRGFSTQSNAPVSIYYDSVLIGDHLRLDLLVENSLIVEIKAVEVMHPVFTAQLLTYLKLSGAPKGLLINFNCERIKHDLISLVSEHYSILPEF